MVDQACRVPASIVTGAARHAVVASVSTIQLIFVLILSHIRIDEGKTRASTRAPSSVRTTLCGITLPSGRDFRDVDDINLTADQFEAAAAILRLRGRRIERGENLSELGSDRGDGDEDMEDESPFGVKNNFIHPGFGMTETSGGQNMESPTDPTTQLRTSTSHAGTPVSQASECESSRTRETRHQNVKSETSS